MKILIAIKNSSIVFQRKLGQALASSLLEHGCLNSSNADIWGGLILPSVRCVGTAAPTQLLCLPARTRCCAHRSVSADFHNQSLLQLPGARRVAPHAPQPRGSAFAGGDTSGPSPQASPGHRAAYAWVLTQCRAEFTAAEIPQLCCGAALAFLRNKHSHTSTEGLL